MSDRKKWREYLLEFAMLFLAVFLGFVSENIRENIAEQGDARGYAISLIQDLKQDSVSINNYIKAHEIIIGVADTLLNLSERPLTGSNATKFSVYTRFMYWTVPITLNRATFEQIKSSGNLKYFENNHLLKELLNYDALINDIEGNFFNHRTRGNMMLTQINKILDPLFHHKLSDISKYNISLLLEPQSENMRSLFATKVESLEKNRNEINEMLNMIVVQQRNLRVANRELVETRKLASQLIYALKREYNIVRLPKIQDTTIVNPYMPKEFQTKKTEVLLV
ncbi:MAG: hypothetical protein QM734_16705 [Cyclobacteriaceae bacterium]